jgi:glycerophosphoryl diester phosphodiesterase
LSIRSIHRTDRFMQLTREGVPVIHHDWTVLLPGSAALRIPVSHLSLPQFLSIEPQPMVQSPDVNEEHAAAAAAVARADRVSIATATCTAPSTTVTQSIGGVQYISAVDFLLVLYPFLIQPLFSSSSLSLTVLNAFNNSATFSCFSLLCRCALTEARSSRAADRFGVDVCPGKSSSRPVLGWGLSSRYCTLEEAFLRCPPALGFNIELKYPWSFEVAAHGLAYAERNAYIDAVLEVVCRTAGDRSICFSTFDADTARAVRLKQASVNYPIVFIIVQFSAALLDSSCVSVHL